MKLKLVINHYLSGKDKGKKSMVNLFGGSYRS